MTWGTQQAFILWGVWKKKEKNPSFRNGFKHGHSSRESAQERIKCFIKVILLLLQWNGGRIFFSMVDFLRWLLFRYPFHPRVTAARSAGGRLQLNTHTPYLCGFEWSDTVTWCMVEWCTQNMRRNGSISRGTSHATPKKRCQYTTSLDINNTRYKRIQSLIHNHMPMCALSLLESRE